MANSAFTPSAFTSASSSTGGSGQGEINIVTNPIAATDVTTAWNKSGLLTVSRDSTGSPLDPVVPTGFTITATGTGSFTTAALSVPLTLRNKKLKIEFYYKQESGAAFTLEAARDTAFTTTSKYTLTTDVSSITTLPATAGTAGKFTAYFDTDSTSSIYVRINSTAAGVFKFTQLIVGPGIQPQGAVVGEWQSYQIQITGYGGTTPTLGTNTTIAKWRRVGSQMEIKFRISQSTAGTAGSGTYLFSLPSGYNRDTSVLIDNQVAACGTAYAFDGTNERDAYPYFTNGETTKFRILTQSTIGFYAEISSTNCPLSLSTVVYSAELRVPIAEWAGSGTVNLAQNDVEYASNNGSATNADDLTSFVYGPSGSAIVGLTGSYRRRVRFQTPIQSTDQIILEVQRGASGPWLPLTSVDQAVGISPTVTQVSGVSPYSTYVYGMGLNHTTLNGINATDVDVVFGNYAYASGQGYGSPGTAWSAYTSINWRVKKVRAGAAVGFGLANATTSGLVSSEDSGTFVSTFGGTGWTTSGNYTINYKKVGKLVTLTFPTIFATSTSSGAPSALSAITTLPTSLRPINGIYLPCRQYYGAGSTNNTGLLEIGINGALTIYLTLSTSGTWPSSTDGGMWGFTCSYITA